MLNTSLQSESGSFQYIEVRDFQRRISELQRANLNLKMIIIDRENQMSRAMVDGKIDKEIITEYIQTAKQTDELKSEIRDLKSELEEAKNTIIELKLQNNAQKDVEDQLRNDMSSLKAKNNLYESREIPESPNSSRNMATLKLELSKLKQDIATQEAKNAELMVEKLNLQSRLNDYENDGIRNESEVTRIKRLLNETKSELSVMKTENDHLKSEIESLNKQIQEKTDKITSKSKKVRSLKRLAQSNTNEINMYNSKFQKRSIMFQSQFDDFVKSVSEQVSVIKEKIEKAQISSQQGVSNLLNNRSKKYQSKVYRQTEIVQRLASLCAKIANIQSSNVPGIDDLMNDPSTLEFFIGRVQSAIEMQRAAFQSDLNKIEIQAKQSIQQQKSALSTTVARFMTNLQGSMNEMTKTLHQDHLQLIGALTMSDDSISE
ncbi:hypothetical protein TRFO_15688 [Tritrichomonas foetus]|uniref:Uncharacterized protein n=1 Tax=Tritrichomonas foetus TaxID=1144522 RepID=A0A1J4KWF0_9EUKA|nr:hypothetical protein TRFO_15688 [Tritrichomonas foetus]|eukprot:OHT14030.1 hypothetical protein TRFO_15688 [Tritrichomonas foetus]